MDEISVPENYDPTVRLRNLGQLGSSVIVENGVPPRRYLRSALEMEKMANIYLEEENLEHSFILYTKLITLLIEKLPQHPQYKLVEAASKADGKKRVTRAFKRAEELKNILRKRYEEDLERWKAKEVERIKLEKEKEEQARLRQAEEQELEKQRQLEREKRDENERLARTRVPLVTPTPSPAEHDGGPEKVPTLNNGMSRLETPETRRAIPTIDRTTKPSWSAFASGLRTVHVPRELMRTFIHVASPNTRQNRETCGILAGRLSQNAFHVSHLVIPKQTSTSDSCTTLNEEEIFSYQDSHNLITLGWIHTHPSQTAFMSSIDLHTHCSYQLMLPEAIAIVCAPKHSQTGMYSLTSEYGLKFISSCKQEGFHPHPKEPPIYEECGHITLNEMSCVLADLR